MVVSPELAAGVLFLAGAVVLAGVFLAVGRSASRAGSEPFEVVTARAYRLRRFWFVFVVLVGLVVLGFTLPHMPNPGVRQSRVGTAAGTVKVVAGQWEWQISPATLPVGKAVRFEVSSRDVNHDFGIFDSGGRIVGQVQAMPGFTNVLYLAFSKSGTYTIRCLELCGLFHTSMVHELTVG